MTWCAEAPGKLVLLGEYAVLKGAPALVVAVQQVARATIARSVEPCWRVSASQLGLSGVPFACSGEGAALVGSPASETRTRLSFFLAVLKEATAGASLPPCHIDLDTSSFFAPGSQRKLGLGSSAAIAVACWGALRAFVGRPSQVAREAFQAVRRAHAFGQGGRGSGIDVAASAHGGALRYALSPETTQPSIESVTFPQGLETLVVWTGESAPTQGFLAAVEAFEQRQPDAASALHERMHAHAEEGCAAFVAGDTDGFLTHAGVYAQLLGELGHRAGLPIVSPVHRKLAELVCRHGGIYKPSGAGGGDMGLAFAASKRVRDALRYELARAGFLVNDLVVAPSGLRVRRGPS